MKSISKIANGKNTAKQQAHGLLNTVTVGKQLKYASV
jgi:hypothetical protein